MNTYTEKTYKNINEVTEEIEVLHVIYRNVNTNFITKNDVFTNVDLKTWLPKHEESLEEDTRIARIFFAQDGKQVVLFED